MNKSLFIEIDYNELNKHNSRDAYIDKLIKRFKMDAKLSYKFDKYLELLSYLKNKNLDVDAEISDILRIMPIDENASTPNKMMCTQTTLCGITVWYYLPHNTYYLGIGNNYSYAQIKTVMNWISSSNNKLNARFVMSRDFQ